MTEVQSSSLNINTDYMTSREAADFLRLGLKTFQNKVSSGKIPYRKLGRSNRFKRSELEQLLEQTKRGPNYD